MSEARRAVDIEVEEDPGFERRNWTFERIGWALMVLAMLAALIGVFGRGPLSRASVGRPDGPFQLRYDRFARLEAPVKLEFRLRPRDDGQARLWLSQDYLHSLRIERIEPEPDTPQTTQDGVLYTFPAAGQDASFRVTIYGVAESMGRHTGRAGPSPDRTYDFWQFVYP